MNRYIKIILTGILCLIFSKANALTSGADFLKIPRSARAIGLGDSYTAIIGDVTAIEYNPAAMNTIENFGVSMMYQKWLDTSYAMYLSGAFKYYGLTFGSSLFVLDYGGFTQYDDLGNAIGEYNPFDMNIKFGVALDGGMLFNFLTGFSVGGCISIIERKLVADNSLGFTFDLGINYETSLAQLQMVQDGHLAHIPLYFGFSIQNLGTAARAITPVKTTLGIATEVVSNFLISMDASLEYGRPLLYKMGFEYTLLDMFIFRLGFNLGKDTGNLNFGLGFQYPNYFNDFRVDYAFSYMGAVGNNHNVSIYIDFPIFVNEVEVLYQEGIYHYVRGEYEKAKVKWEQALKLEPENKVIQKKLEDIDKMIQLSEMID